MLFVIDDVINKFERFAHRNLVLCSASTAIKAEFLKSAKPCNALGRAAQYVIQSFTGFFGHGVIREANRLYPG